MFALELTIDHLLARREEVASGRNGMIETVSGQWGKITLCSYRKLLCWPEIWPVAAKFHGQGPGDRCRLYYHQPRSAPDYLALKYAVSTEQTSLKTFFASLMLLDAVAAIKGSDAIVCDASNKRLTDRVMRRLGWEPHKPSRWHRHYIRRFYGAYPPSVAILARAAAAERARRARNAQTTCWAPWGLWGKQR